MNTYKILTCLSIAIAFGATPVFAQMNQGTTEAEVLARYQFLNHENLTNKVNISSTANAKTVTLKDLSNTIIRTVAFNSAQTNLYNSPDLNSKLSATISPQVLNVLSQNGSWIQISTWMGPKWIYNGDGTIEVKSIIPYRRQMTLYERVSLHNQPFAKYDTTATVSPQTVQVLEKTGDNWYKIRSYAGIKWVNTTLATFSEPSVPSGLTIPNTSTLGGIVTGATQLNIRNQPSTAGSILGILNSGDTIDIISVENGWAKFLYNGQTAYSSASYLTINEDVQLNPNDEIGNFKLYSKGTLKLYSKPSTDFFSGATVSPQVINAAKRVDKFWYQVSTWMGPMYINMEEAYGGYATDNIINTSGQLTLSARTNLYSQPFDAYSTGASLSPQTINYIASFNGYRLINSWMGPVWIKISEPTYPVVEEQPVTGTYALVTSSGQLNYVDESLALSDFQKINDNQAYLMSGTNVIAMKSGFVRTNAFTIIYSDNGTQLTYVSANTEMEYRYATADKVYITIAGENGYINLSNAELVPTLKGETRSSYRRDSSNNFIHRIYSGTSSYYDLNFGYAPTDLTVGQNYVSSDSKQLNNQDSYEYFMFMPIPVKASYTADELDNFIKTYSPNSPLIGTGKYFVASADKYGLNVGYLLAHAIHESAWGTSQIAIDKNNLFGFKAVDSDPYAGAATFDNLADGIDYCASYISQNYINTSNWTYNGGFLGDKSEGMNVEYASDPYWGEKIAGYMHRLDVMYGNKELNKNPLGKLNVGIPIYTLNGTTPVFKGNLSKATFALKLNAIDTGVGIFYQVTSDNLSDNNNIYVRMADFNTVKSY